MAVSKGQTKQMAEILGNLSVAWFTAGIIGPFYISKNYDIKFIGLVMITISISGIMALFSVSLLKDQ